MSLVLSSLQAKLSFTPVRGGEGIACRGTDWRLRPSLGNLREPLKDSSLKESLKEPLRVQEPLKDSVKEPL